MTNFPQKSEIFHPGGAVPSDHAFYITRKVDNDLFEACLAGEYCNVLETRQVGKTSLLRSVEKRLKQEGVYTTWFDLQKWGKGMGENEYNFYYSLLREIIKSCGLKLDIIEFLPKDTKSITGGFSDGVTEVLKLIKGQPLVVMFDEIEMVGTYKFNTDDFFFAWRHLYNQRAENSLFDKLSVVFVGTTTANSLVQDNDRTPFNIGQTLRLDDFTRCEAEQFKLGFGLKEPLQTEVMNQVYDWTDGHPYLTQVLCSEVAKEETNLKISENIAAKIQSIVENKVLKGSDRFNNVAWVKGQLLEQRNDGISSHEVLEWLQKVINSQLISGNESDPIIDRLRLSGVVKKVDGKYKIRNKIYASQISPSWVKKTLGDYYLTDTYRLWKLEKQADQYMSDGTKLLTTDELEVTERFLSTLDGDMEISLFLENLIEQSKLQNDRNQVEKRRSIRLRYITIVTTLGIIGMLLGFVFSLNNSNRKLESTLNELGISNERVDGLYSELENTNSQLISTLDQLETEKDRAVGLNTELESKNLELEGTLSQLELSNTALKTEKDRVVGLNTELESKNLELGSTLSQLELSNTALKTEKNRVDGLNTDLESKNLELESILSQLKLSNTALQTEKGQVERLNTELKSKNSELESTFSQLELSNTALQSEKNRVVGLNTELESKNSELESTLSQLKLSNTALETEKNRVDGLYINLQKTLSALQIAQVEEKLVEEADMARRLLVRTQSTNESNPYNMLQALNNAKSLIAFSNVRRGLVDPKVDIDSKGKIFFENSETEFKLLDTSNGVNEIGTTSKVFSTRINDHNAMSPTGKWIVSIVEDTPKVVFQFRNVETLREFNETRNQTDKIQHIEFVTDDTLVLGYRNGSIEIFSINENQEVFLFKLVATVMPSEIDDFVVQSESLKTDLVQIKNIFVLNNDLLLVDYTSGELIAYNSNTNWESIAKTEMIFSKDWQVEHAVLMPNDLDLNNSGALVVIGSQDNISVIEYTKPVNYEFNSRPSYVTRYDVIGEVSSVSSVLYNSDSEKLVIFDSVGYLSWWNYSSSENDASPILFRQGLLRVHESEILDAYLHQDRLITIALQADNYIIGEWDFIDILGEKQQNAFLNNSVAVYHSESYQQEVIGPPQMAITNIIKQSESTWLVSHGKHSRKQGYDTSGVDGVSQLRVIQDDLSEELVPSLVFNFDSDQGIGDWIRETSLFEQNGITLAVSVTDANDNTNGRIIVWNPTTGTELHVEDKAHDNWVLSAKTLDHKWLLSGDRSGQLKTWKIGVELQGEELDQPLELLSTYENHSNAINKIALSSNSSSDNKQKEFATCSSDGTIKLWQADIESSLEITLLGELPVNTGGFGEKAVGYGFADCVYTTIYNESDANDKLGVSTLLAVTSDGNLYIIDSPETQLDASKSSIQKIQISPGQRLRSVAINLAGTLIAVGSNNGQVYLINKDKTSKQLLVFDAGETSRDKGENPIYDLEFVKANDKLGLKESLMIASRSGVLGIVDLSFGTSTQIACLKAGRVLTEAEFDEYFEFDSNVSFERNKEYRNHIARCSVG